MGKIFCHNTETYEELKKYAFDEYHGSKQIHFDDDEKIIYAGMWVDKELKDENSCHPKAMCLKMADYLSVILFNVEHNEKFNASTTLSYSSEGNSYKTSLYDPRIGSLCFDMVDSIYYEDDDPRWDTHRTAIENEAFERGVNPAKFENALNNSGFWKCFSDDALGKTDESYSEIMGKIDKLVEKIQSL